MNQGSKKWENANITRDVLSRSDGSQEQDVNGTHIRGGMYGPISKEANREKSMIATLEVNVHLRSSNTSLIEREQISLYEVEQAQKVYNIQQSIQILEQYPRSQIVYNFQILNDNGSQVATLINTAIALTIDTGQACRYICIAVCLGVYCTDNNKTYYMTQIDKNQIKLAKSVLTITFIQDNEVTHLKSKSTELQVESKTVETVNDGILGIVLEHGEIQDTQLIDILEKGRKEASSVANFIWKNMNRTLTKTATEENTDKVK